MESPNNLSELLAHLKTLSLPTPQTFARLQELLGNEIAIRYEFIDDSADAEPIDGPFGALNGRAIGRVLLTTKRSRANFSRKLVRQCNGVVLEYPSWRVLSVPPQMFNPSFTTADISKNMADYKIYEINDGTTVTLYWHDGKWCLSTTNGFDVCDFKWIGSHTYWELFREVSKKYPEFDLEKLSKDKCYTIGFRHHEFHPLLTDPDRMWAIQTCDTRLATDGNFAIGQEYFGLPSQTLVKPPAWSRTFIYKMIETNKTALANYLATGKIHYGYVLRKSTGPHSNIIMESNLLKQIRTHMYNLPKNLPNALEICADTRLEYTILRAYLNYSTKYEFIKLFPQFTHQYEKYDVIFDKLTRKVIYALRNRNVREFLLKSPRAKLDNVVAIIVGNIERAGKVNVIDSQGPLIVRDYIMDRRHLNLYYNNLIL